MSRSAEAVHAEIVSLTPEGWVWPRAGSLFAALFQPPATAIADLEATAEAMMDEIDPRSAVLCLTDFERVLGPDPCGRDPTTLTLSARQKLAHQRWTARGGASIPYFIGYAAKRGVTIAIEEVRLSRVGRFRAGHRLVDAPQQFFWKVTLPLTTSTIFRAGRSSAGERLYDIALTGIECDLRRLKPAHTEVAFRYLAAPSLAPSLDFSVPANSQYL